MPTQASGDSPTSYSANVVTGGPFISVPLSQVHLKLLTGTEAVVDDSEHVEKGLHGLGEHSLMSILHCLMGLLEGYRTVLPAVVVQPSSHLHELQLVRTRDTQ